MRCWAIDNPVLRLAARPACFLSGFNLLTLRRGATTVARLICESVFAGAEVFGRLTCRARDCLLGWALPTVIASTLRAGVAVAGSWRGRVPGNLPELTLGDAVH